MSCMTNLGAGLVSLVRGCDHVDELATQRIWYYCRSSTGLWQGYGDCLELWISLMRAHLPAQTFLVIAVNLTSFLQFADELLDWFLVLLCVQVNDNCVNHFVRCEELDFWFRGSDWYTDGRFLCLSKYTAETIWWWWRWLWGGESEEKDRIESGSFRLCSFCNWVWPLHVQASHVLGREYWHGLVVESPILSPCSDRAHLLHAHARRRSTFQVQADSACKAVTQASVDTHQPYVSTVSQRYCTKRFIR